MRSAAAGLVAFVFVVIGGIGVVGGSPTDRAVAFYDEAEDLASIAAILATAERDMTAVADEFIAAAPGARSQADFDLMQNVVRGRISVSKDERRARGHRRAAKDGWLRTDRMHCRIVGVSSPPGRVRRLLRCWCRGRRFFFGEQLRVELREDLIEGLGRTKDRLSRRRATELDGNDEALDRLHVDITHGPCE